MAAGTAWADTKLCSVALSVCSTTRAKIGLVTRSLAPTTPVLPMVPRPVSANPLRPVSANPLRQVLGMSRRLSPM